jgi:hypothetical protein
MLSVWDEEEEAFGRKRRGSISKHGRCTRHRYTRGIEGGILGGERGRGERVWEGGRVGMESYCFVCAMNAV